MFRRYVSLVWWQLQTEENNAEYTPCLVENGLVQKWRHLLKQKWLTRLWWSLEYLYWRVMSWAVPKKSGHVVHGAILFPRLLMHSRQNDGILCIWMQKIGLKRDLRCINPCKSGDGSYLKKLTSPPKGGGRNGNFRGSTNQKSGKCHELSRKSITFVFTHPTRGGGFGGGVKISKVR